MKKGRGFAIGAAATAALLAFANAAIPGPGGAPFSSYVSRSIVGIVDSISTIPCVEGQACQWRMNNSGAGIVQLVDPNGNYVDASLGGGGGGGTPIEPGHYLITQFRCDNSGSITGTSGPVGGITCTSGSWFDAVDARGALVGSLSVYEYGAGSGSWSLWNCVNPAGSSGIDAIPGVAAPGIEDPNSAPSSADPDPLCTKVNLDSAGAEIPITGNLTKEVHLNSRTFDYLVVRTDTCTGNCDASLEVQVRW